VRGSLPVSLNRPPENARIARPSGYSAPAELLAIVFPGCLLQNTEVAHAERLFGLGFQAAPQSRL
jgi:hypothetical protein